MVFRGPPVLIRYVDAYNRGAWDEIDELVTADYVHHSNAAALNLAQFKRGAIWFRDPMPDFRIEVQDVVSEGDRAAVRFTATGTHQGSLFGEATTGRSVTLYGTTIYRLEGDRIAEDWEAMDEADLRRQVGAAQSA